MDPIVIASIVAVGGLGILFGVGLALASKKFAVHVDPRIEEVEEALPNANCGACGYPGCSAFAEAVVKGEISPDGCSVGGATVAEKIAEILGVSIEVPRERMIAVTQCQGGVAEAKDRFEYHGIEDCAAAELIDGGHKACTYGCLGLGTCAKACPFDALHMNENKLPVVDEAKCTGCGICVEVCPRDIMKLIPVSQKMYLGCVNPERGKAVQQVCSVGCVGCTVCANPKFVSSGAIKMNGWIPEILDGHAEDLIIAWQKCPTNSFVWRGPLPVGYEKGKKSVKEDADVPWTEPPPAPPPPAPKKKAAPAAQAKQEKKEAGKANA